jgi:ABC-2 type transport system permease protein
MTALETTSAFVRPTTSRPSLLMGVRPIINKELHEWMRSRRALILLLVSVAMMVLNTLSARFGEASLSSAGVPGPSGLSLDPTTNVLVKWPQWVFFFAIVFSANLLVVERDRGTLAWTLSKPISRSALLIGKWAAAMVMFTVFGIVSPMVASVVAAIAAYGWPDIGSVVLATVLLAATPAFLIALTLALATVLPSQPAVAGVAVGVVIGPMILGSWLPGITGLAPSSMASWAVAVAMGQPVTVITPLAWVVGMATVTLFGIARLRRVDL